MSSIPQLDCVGSLDPIISSVSSALSPTRSPLRTRPESYSPIHGTATCQRHNGADTTISEDPVTASEREPLLHGRLRSAKKPFYRPRPLWLVPFVIITSLVRGMTLAPRVEIFTQLACGTIRSHYNHTTILNNTTILSPDTVHNSYTPRYLSLDSNYIMPMHNLEADSDNDSEEDDPRNLPSKRCMSDPAVQAAAARLQTIMTTTMGTLSALTTGWWSHFGERHGRTRVLALSTLGLFLTDVTFILVTTPDTPFSTHGHKFLIIAPFIEGLLGGWSTLQSATNAYISDCTSDGSRAQIFSRFAGAFYLGLSAGPVIGAFLIKHPFTRVDLHPIQSVTSVFWVAIVCSGINIFLTTFVFPESLPKDKQAVKTIAPGDADGEEASEAANKKAKDWMGLGIIKGFLNPLALFLPNVVQGIPGKRRKDWSLTFLALALFGYMLSMGLFQIKYMYAEHVYGWGAEQLSYYISWVGGLRAVNLLFVLPFIIATFKPKTSPTAFNSEPLIKHKPTRTGLVQEIYFDIFLTRLSLILDILSHTFVVLLPSPNAKIHALSRKTGSYSQIMFIAASSLSSFGSGVVPAIQSLALCVLQSRSLANAGASDEDVGIGRLFGALAVLQAVGQMILGPMLFGLVYSSMVATYPKAIFATAAGICAVSLILVFMIRPDIKGRRKRARAGVAIERGRSRVSKDLRVYVPVERDGAEAESGSSC